MEMERADSVGLFENHKGYQRFLVKIVFQLGVHLYRLGVHL